MAGRTRVGVCAVGGGDPMDPRGDGVSGLMEKLKLFDNEKEGDQDRGC